MSHPTGPDPTDVPTGDRVMKWQVCPFGPGVLDFGVGVVDLRDDHGHCPWGQTASGVRTEDAPPDVQAWSCTRCGARWALSPFDARAYQAVVEAINRFRQLGVLPGRNEET